MAQEKILAVRVELTGVTEESRQISQLNGELDKLAQKRNELNKTIKQNGQATREETNELTANEQSTRDLTAKKNQLLQTEKASAKEFKAAAGSMNELRAKTSALRNEANNLNLTTEAGRRRFKELGGQITDNTKKIRDYDRSISGSSTMVGEYSRGIMNAFMKVGVAVAGAWGIIKAGEKVIMSAQGSSEKWEATIKGVKTGLDDMFKSLATGDFSGFLSGIGQAIIAGKEYTEVMHDLEKSARAYAMEEIDERNEILLLMRTMKDKTSSDQERLDAAKLIEQKEEELSKRKEEIAREAYEAEKERIAITSRLSQEELENYVRNYDQLKENIEIGEKYLELERLKEKAATMLYGAGVQLVGQYEKEQEALGENAEALGEWVKHINRASKEELDALVQKYVAMGDAHNQYLERTKRIDSQLHSLEAELIKEDQEAQKEADEKKKKSHEENIKRIQNEIKEVKELIEANEALRKKEIEVASRNYENWQRANEGLMKGVRVPGGKLAKREGEKPEEAPSYDEQLDALIQNQAWMMEIKKAGWEAEERALKESLLRAEITEADYLRRRAEAYGYYFKQTSDNVLFELGNMIGAMEQFGEGSKALALAKIGIDTAQAISSLVTYSEANPLNAVTWGGAAIIQYATGLIRILANIASARRYLIGKGKAEGGLIGSDDGIRLISPTPKGDNMLILAKKDELVLNTQQQSYIGHDAFRRAGVPGFAEGGRIGTRIGAAGINYASSGLDTNVIRQLGTIADRLNDIEIYVTANEIQEGLKKYAKVRAGKL